MRTCYEDAGFKLKGAHLPLCPERRGHRRAPPHLSELFLIILGIVVWQENFLLNKCIQASPRQCSQYGTVVFGVLLPLALCVVDSTMAI